MCLIYGTFATIPKEFQVSRGKIEHHFQMFSSTPLSQEHLPQFTPFLIENQHASTISKPSQHLEFSLLPKCMNNDPETITAHLTTALKNYQTISERANG